MGQPRALISQTSSFRWNGPGGRDADGPHQRHHRRERADQRSYSYQWIRSDNGTDADIAGQTDSTYTLVAADQGKTIKVRVSFTDDANNTETLTSAATGVVEAKPKLSGHGSAHP